MPSFAVPSRRGLALALPKFLFPSPTVKFCSLKRYTNKSGRKKWVCGGWEWAKKKVSERVGGRRKALMVTPLSSFFMCFYRRFTRCGTKQCKYFKSYLLFNLLWLSCLYYSQSFPLSLYFPVICRYLLRNTLHGSTFSVAEKNKFLKFIIFYHHY